jgi:hypothetical protein
MKSAKHISFLNLGSFPGVVMFSVGFTYDEVLKISTKKYGDWALAVEKIQDVFQEDNNIGFASKRVVKDINYFFLVLKKVFDFKDQSHVVLAHEALHVISFVLCDILDPMVENEAFCYTHSHILEQCYKILRS